MKKYIVILLSALSLLFVSCKEQVIDVLGVTIDKQSQNLSIGETFVLKAVISPSNATNQSVIWSTSNSSVLEIKDNGDGTVLVKGLETGTAQIIVKTDDGALTDKCTVNVGAAVESIEIDKSEMSLEVGETSQLTAVVKPSNASNTNVLWTSDSPSVASVDANGKVTAVAGGEATIIASTSDGGFTASCKVSVICPVKSISLNETMKDDLYLGEAFKLDATIFPAEATNKNVTWKSSDEKVAKVASDGTVTALNPGTVKITVTTEDGGFQASCVVNVKCFANHIDINHETLDLVEGQTEQLIATVYPEQATDKTLAWSSDKPEIASVSTDGKVTALKAGTAVITVTTGQNISKTCTVTVTSPVSGITIDASSIAIMPGATYQLMATISPANASNQDMTWSSDNEAVATVSQKGLVTAVAPGSTCVHVTTADGGKTAKCLVDVLIPAKGVTLDLTSVSLTVSESKKLNATVTPSNATNKNVAWSSSDESIVKVDQNGNVTALKSGTATVTVTTENGGFTASCKVTVKQPVTSVSLNTSTLTVYIDDPQTLTAKVSPDDATDKSVTWTTSDATIATVDNGKVTGKKVGTVKITVKTNDQGKEASCIVNVKRHVSSVSLDKTAMTLGIDETAQLNATVSPSDASNKNVTWSSSNSSVASVSSAGVVTGVGIGDAVITVKTADGSYTATCKVSVIKATIKVTNLTLDPTTLSLQEGAVSSLKLTITPADATQVLTWSSSNESVVTVKDGDLTAVSQGTATITVATEDNSVKATCKVTVTEKVDVTGVTLDKTALSLTTGESETITATVSPDDAKNKTVTWTSSNSSIASVDSNGKVTAVGAGTATITATTKVGSFKASCTVTVTEVLIPITKIDYAEKNTKISMYEGESRVITVTVTPSNANEALQVKPATNCPVRADYQHTAGSAEWKVKITALYKTGSGAVYIDSENYSTMFNITVLYQAVESVTLNRSEMSMRVGETGTLEATVLPENASTKTVTWESSNSSVAYVSQAGVITAKSAGKVYITATCGGKSVKCTLLVRDSTVSDGGAEGVGFDEWN